MINQLKSEFLKFLRNDSRLYLFLLVFFGAFTYLPLISKLGFYNEDWYILWARKFFGPEKIIDMHLIDRPLMGIHHALMNLAFGDNAIFYHIYMMILRIAGAILVYFLINKVLSGKKEEGFFGGLAFLVFPGFLVQPVAMTHTSYLLAFDLISGSILISLYDFTQFKKRSRFLIVSYAILLMLFSYLIMEWFIVIEIFRVILLGYVIAQKSISTKKDLAIRVLKRYLPYLMFAMIFLIWRVFFFTSGRETTDLRIIVGNYISNPVESLLSISTLFIQNTLNTLFSSWIAPLYRLLNYAPAKIIFLACLWSLLGVFLLAAVLKLKKTNTETPVKNNLEVLIIGLLLVLFSGTILAATGRKIIFENLNNKYILPGVFGISFIIAGIFRSIPGQKWRTVIISVIFGLSIITNILNTAYYRNFWDIERNIWWQLSWRTPDITKDTVILPILPSGYGLIDNYEIWPQADLTYGSEQDPLKVMGEVVNTETLDEILNQDTYGRTIKRIPTIIDLKNSLVLSMTSIQNCLNVGNGTNLLFSANTLPFARIISSISDVNLLDIAEIDWKVPPTSVFGIEPDHTWCYYFQKSELALQRKNWNEITAYIDQAVKSGYSPNDLSEWIPAYIGYAYSGQIDKANEIGGFLRSDPEFVNLFCSNNKPYPFGGDSKTDHFLYINICGEDETQLP